MAVEFVALEQEGKLVGIVGVALVGILRPLFLHQRVIVAEVELAHVGPVAKVVAIWGDGDFRFVGGGLGRETLFGIPSWIEVGDFLGGGGVWDIKIHRALPENDIGGAVVEGAIHHHANAPLVEALDESLEFGVGTGRAVGAAEHGGNAPVVANGVGAAGIEDFAGLGIGVAAFDADRMDRLQPEHVHAERCVVVFVERVGAPLISAVFAGNRRIIDQIEERAASFERYVLRLHDKRIDLIHVHLERFLG